MSDDNYRKPSSPRSTQAGLGLISTDGSYDRRPNETLSGRGATGRNYGSLADSDDRYMDPPSETHGDERDELVRRLNEDAAARARTAAAPSYRPVQTPAQGLFGSTLRAHTAGHARFEPAREAQRYTRQQPDAAPGEPYNGGNVGLFQGALDHTLQAPPVAAQAAAATRPQPPPVGGRAAAPEAWRDEVRRMVERAPTNRPAPPAPSVPSPQQPSGPSGLGGFGGPGGPSGPSVPGSSKPSLRLKLDADAVEESYRAPKSGLPKLLVWLAFLGLIGGGFAYFAQSQGGVAALIKRFSTAQPTLTTQDPQPPAAAASTAPTVDPNAPMQQPPAAAVPAAEATQAPPQAAAPAAVQPASAAPAPAAPQAAAKPAEAPAAVPKPPADSPKAAEPQAAKPAPKPAAPKPARPVRPQQPVVKVRPIESAPSAPETTAPPTPDHPDIPYVPMPGDPPAPDEPR
jgi:hypothetical protein